MPPARLGSRSLALALFGLVLLVASSLGAQPEPSTSGVNTTPTLRPAAPPHALAGRALDRIEIVEEGTRWHGQPTVRRVRIGDRVTAYLARLAMRELLDTGRYASVSAELEERGGEAVLQLRAVPRRVAGSVRLTGAPLLVEEAVRASGLDVGEEVTDVALTEQAERIVRFYRRRGYPDVTVRVDAVDTDDPLRVLVIFGAELGAPSTLGRRVFQVARRSEALDRVLEGYGVVVGDRADEEALVVADGELRRELRAAGWHRATVRHELKAGKEGTELWLSVDAGPRIRVRFRGLRSIDDSDALSVVEGDDVEQLEPASMARRLSGYYVERGFLDVRVTTRERGRPDEPVHDLIFDVKERSRVRVVAREYPCLTGDRSPDDVGSEIDGVLSEVLPGADFLTPVDGAVVDGALGPHGRTGARPVPLRPNPWSTYSPEAYDRVTEHLRELYRSEGYLSAAIGPVVLLRRRCDPRSPPGICRPLGERVRPQTTCPKTDTDLPVEDPAPSADVSCTPDPARGVRCEPEVVLHMPIKPGPRAYFYDVRFEGNDLIVDRDLFELAELELSTPVSQVELEKARRRVLDAYAEEGFAFASVEIELDLSPDRTRARARFVISERERVRVKGIVVRGARLTNESLVRDRVRLEPGGLYRRSLVRETEELLATLGVFSSVTVGLEDPEVPAREKMVVVSVVERPPQYLDVRPGFSTGEGMRITFEYGHRNLAGEAIQLTLRVQLGYLPSLFILDPDVRRKFDQLDLADRLERRNTVSVEFPQIGLGPLFRLGIDGVDVRDNARDYGITKDAIIGTVSYRPTRRFTAHVGASVERNDARIFSNEQLDVYLMTNPGARNLLLFPDGTTIAFAQRTGVAWDRRDDPFGATRGTFVSGDVEHVRALPLEDATINSQFLRFTSRIAGYVPFTDDGLSLALSFRWGTNTQLTDQSQTYPDRLFFLGGVDSIRGFLQDSVVPQEIAERILSTASLPDDDPEKVTERDVAIRGGDFMMNPRAELRIPLGGIWQTALFFDAGNVWVDPENIDPTVLRYASGTGLRAKTPVGPLAFDVGANLARRDWEDPFAFHFSIGLF